jgi:hypothetical protein
VEDADPGIAGLRRHRENRSGGDVLLGVDRIGARKAVRPASAGAIDPVELLQLVRGRKVRLDEKTGSWHVGESAAPSATIRGMRDWCVVLDLTSAAAAKQVGRSLRAETRGLDLDVDAVRARVWAFEGTEGGALAVADEMRGVLQKHDLWERVLQCEPTIRVWSESRHRYVDPREPDEDPDTGEVSIESELDPDAIRWRVRLRLESVFEFRRVRRQLPRLHRPVIGTGNRHVDLGARDEGDAEDVAAAARGLAGVATVTVHPVGGRLRRWWLRQRLAGNYLPPDDASGPRSWTFDFGHGGAHGGGHGGGQGGGHHGGGGHGGGGHGG